jgi:hypothetical protein
MYSAAGEEACLQSANNENVFEIRRFCGLSALRRG